MTTRIWAMLSILMLAMFCQQGFSQEQTPEAPPQDAPKSLGSKIRAASDLVDQDPFDRIYLDDLNQFATMDVVPLPEIPRKPFPQNGYLIFDLMDGSWPTLQVPWPNVSDYKTFNDLLSEEAELLVTKAEYAHAFRNLLYVLDHGEKSNPAIEARLQQILFLDGKANYDAGNFAMSLSIFEDLYRRNPRFEIRGISLTSIELILDCYDRSVKQFFDADEFDSARALLKGVQERYTKEAVPLVEKWSKNFSDLAQELLGQSKEFLSQEKPREARVAARRAINVDPQLDEAYILFDEVIAKYPIVFVGTSQPALDPNPNRLEDWASRRVGRLTQRRIVELVGLSDEGGRYEFINGNFVQTDEVGLNYRFQIDAEPAGFAVPKLTSFELASILLRQGDPNNPKHSTAWAKILKTVSVTGESTVDIELKVPYVRPEALMSFPFREFEKDSEDQTGPYIIADKQERFQTFEINKAYPLTQGSQYPRISEWLYNNPSEASDALRKGLVDAVDRIPPSDIGKLRAHPDIEVRPYLVPTVHMLVPNLRSDFNKNPTFRSGLLKAINRQQILDDICAGQKIDGMAVIEGPFPIGSDDNTQVSYGYNTRVSPVQFAQLIGAVFVEAVRQSMITKLIEKGVKEPEVKIPTLVLAYPQGDVPAFACRKIANYWNSIGVKTQLRQLPPGVTIPTDKNFDFLYCELTITEPLSDADFLFGSKGIVKELSAPIEQMMRSVNVSNSWRAASTNLRQLHRQVLNDVAVLPLWQMREHYAFRSNIREVGRDLMYLYQYVDRWQIGSIRSKE